MGCSTNEISNSNLYNKILKAVGNPSTALVVYTKSINDIKEGDKLDKAGEPYWRDVKRKYKDLIGTPTKDSISNEQLDIMPNVDKNPINYTYDTSISKGISNENKILTGVYPNDYAKENHAINILSDAYIKLKNANAEESTIQASITASIKAIANRETDATKKDYLNTLLEDLTTNGLLYNKMLASSKVNKPFADFTDLEDDGEVTEGSSNTKINYDDTKRDSKTISERIDNDIKDFFNTIPVVKSIAKQADTYDASLNMYGIIRDNNGKVIDNITRKIYDINTDTYSGLGETASFNSMYKTIIHKADFTSYDNFLNSLMTLARNINPTYSVVYNRLKANEDMARKIYSKFNMAKVVRTTSIYQNTDNGRAYLSRDNENSNEILRAINNINNIVNAQAIVYNDFDFIQTRDNLLSSGELASKSEENLTNTIEEIVDIFNAIGLQINEDVINRYLNNSSDREKISTSDILTTEQKSKLLNINIINPLSDILQEGNNVKNEFAQFKERRELANRENKLFNETFDKGLSVNHIIRPLIERLSNYTETIVESVSTNVDNNLVSDVQNHNFMSRLFQMKDNNRTEFINTLKLMKQTPRLSYSNIINDMYNDNDFVNNDYIDKLNLSTPNGIKNTITGNVSKYSNITKSDWLFSSLLLFENNGHDSLANYYIQTPSDAGNTRLIQARKYKFTSNLAKDVNNPAFIAISNIIKSELAGIIQANQFVFEYDDNGNLVYENGKPKVNKINESNFINNYHYKGNRQLFDSNNKVIGNTFKFIDSNISENNSLNNLPIFNKFGLIENLNENIREAVETIYSNNEIQIKNYISDLVNDIHQQALNEYSNIINDTDIQIPYAKDEEINRNIKSILVQDSAISYFITYNELSNISSGSTAFYKNNVDTVKRRKQIVAGGYSNINTADTIMNTDTFNYVTMNDVVVTPEDVSIMINNLIKNGYSQEAAEIITKPYKSVNITDGQSYITLDEAEKRFRIRGEENKYKNTIKAIREGKDFDSATMSPIEEQKNFYYKYNYNPSTNLFEPIQFKNSEYVLNPIAIKGTNLEYINDWMLANNIGQLNFKSAEKVVTHNIVDSNIDNLPQDVSPYVNIGDYGYLYLQLEVPSHSKDAKNKAVMVTIKKVLENTNDTETANDLMKNLIANIEESAIGILDELGIQHDNNRISYNTDTGLVNLDLDKFLNRVKIEFLDRGLNSNYMDYVNINPNTGDTYMPMYDNRVRSKITSVLNSLFTNNITNQKLQGGHYAQLSNAFTESKYIEQSKESPLRKLKLFNTIEVDGKVIAGEAEVLLPSWSRQFFSTGEVNITPEKLHEKLEKAGLTKMFGYRMPTEGKQSTIVFKVVGFLPDYMGSTIMLPDNFVAKTGADFDIDSVYTINYNFRKINIYNKEGDIVDIDFKKIEYSDSKEELSNRYISYIRSNIDKDSRNYIKEESSKTAKDTNKEFKNVNIKLAENKYKEDYGISNSIMNEYKAKLDLLFNRNREIFKVLPNKIRAIYFYNREINPNLKGLDSLLLSNEITEELLSNSERLNKNFPDKTELAKVITLLETLNSTENEIIEVISEKDEYVEQAKKIYKNNKSILKSNIESVLEESFELYKQPKNTIEFELSKAKAKELGLKSFSDFTKLPIEKQNSREARDNRILDDIFKLIQNPNAYGEYVTTSNFQDMLSARKYVENKTGETSKYRNPNYFNNQSYWREQSINGRDLKGQSIARDSLLSVMSNLKIRLDSSLGFKHTYKLNDVVTLESLYNKYGEELVQDNKDGTVTVNHTMLGWTRDNNVGIHGQKITQYSSQTTANILDNVAEPILNTITPYSFKAFKTMIDLGMSYNTASLYFAQPIMIELINQYNDTNSIYKNKGRYVYANTEGVYKKELFKLLSDINPVPKELIRYKTLANSNNRFFIRKADIEAMNNYLGLSNDIPVLTNSKLTSNLNTERNVDFYRNQLGILNTIKHLFDIANTIGAYQKVMTTDKKGAGETFDVTKDFFRSIHALKTKPIKENNASKDIYMDGKNHALIEDIFPGEAELYDIDNFNEHNFGTLRSYINQAEHPLFIANLVYSNLLSYTVNSSRFVTESYGMKQLEKSLGINFSNNIKNKFYTYIINSLYDVPFMYTSKIANTELQLSEDKARQFTIRRVLGNHIPTISEFDFKDSDESKNTWLTLSPANKLFLINKYFDDSRNDDNILSFLKPIIKEDSHRINFIDNALTDPEYIFKLYNDLYYNSNPYLREFARDLVRYSYYQEGFSFGFNNVSKILPNNVFTSMNDEDGGIIDIVKSRAARFFLKEEFDNWMANTGDDLVHMFTRANSFNKELVPIYINPNRPDRLRIIPGTKPNIAGSNALLLIDNDELSRLIGNKNIRYIRTNPFTNNRKTVLYRIYNYTEDYSILIPTNKLGRYEYTNDSSLSENRIEASFNTYDSILKEVLLEEDIKTLGNFVKVGLNNQITLKSSIEDVFTKAINTGVTSVALFSSEANNINIPEGETRQVDIQGDKYNITNLGLQVREDVEGDYSLPEGEKWNSDIPRYIFTIRTLKSSITDTYSITDKEKEFKLRDYIQRFILTMHRQSLYKTDDANIINIKKELDKLGFNTSDTTTDIGKNNQLAVLRLTYLYFNNTISPLLSQINSITDGVDFNSNEFYESLANNQAKKDAFISLIDAINDINNKFSVISTLETYTKDDDSLTKSINKELTKIKSFSSSISNLLAYRDRSIRLFIDKVLSKESTNPDIVNGNRLLTDKIDDIGNIQLWLDAVHDSDIPLLSVSSKIIFQDIQEGEILGNNNVKKFNKKYEQIKKNYRERTGKELSINDLLDEDANGGELKGFIVTPFTDGYKVRFSELRDAMQAAKRVNGDNSSEYLSAYREYKDFENRFLEQPQVYEYVKAKQEYRNILHKNPEAKRLYEEINSERFEILNNQRKNKIELNEDERERLKELNAQLQELRNPYTEIEDELGIIRQIPKEGEALNIANVITEYEKARDSFNDLYNVRKVDPIFKTLLDSKLNILSVSDRTSDEYIEAKNWLADNASRVLTDESKAILDNIKKVFGKKGQIEKEYTKRFRYDEDGEAIPSTYIKWWDAGKYHYIINERNTELKNSVYETTEGIPDRQIRFSQQDASYIYNSAYYDDLKYSSTGTNLKNNIAYKNYIGNKQQYEAQINNILSRYIVPSTGVADTSRLTVDELNKISELQARIERLNNELWEDKRFRFAYRNFISYIRNDSKGWFNKVHESVVDSKGYRQAKTFAEKRGPEYLEAWNRLNTTEDGKPNQNWISYKVRDEYIDKYVDEAKTEAINKFKSNFEIVPTKYYAREYTKQLAKPEEEFKKWYDANHLRNPYTNQITPIKVWTSLKAKNKDGYKYLAKQQWVDSSPLSKYNNENYNDNKYYNPSPIDKETGAPSPYINRKYESIKNDKDKFELYNLVADTIDNITKNTGKLDTRDSGLLPSLKVNNTKLFNKDGKFWEKIGWFNLNQEELTDEFGNTSYRLRLPMLDMLDTKDYKSIPVRENGENIESYEQRVKEVQDYNRNIRYLNKESHSKAILHDYDKAMETFIKRGTMFNQLNKTASVMNIVSTHLNNTEYVKRSGDGRIIPNRLKETIFGIKDTKADKTGGKAAEQFNLFVKRIVFNQFEIDEGIVTKVGRVFGNLTSSRFMWLNVLGGINNIAIGKAQMQMETFGKVFWDRKSRYKAEAEYWRNAPSFVRDIYSNDDKASSKMSALIKKFDILNTQRELGIAKTDLYAADASHSAFDKFNDVMYSPQSIGEHYMQNMALMAMAYSHRMIDGKPTSIHNFKLNNRINALKSILTDEKKAEFDKWYSEHAAEDKYRYLRSDILLDYIQKYYISEGKEDSNVELLRKFRDKIRELDKISNDEFNNYTTVYDTFGFNDKTGELTYDENVWTPKNIANFKYKVEGVNKHIHGIYDKFGASKLQMYAIGRLAVQFKKHMRPGWNKRFGARLGKGHYNENRETYDKGAYISFFEFLSTPIKQSDFLKLSKEGQYVAAFGDVLKRTLSFLRYLKLNYDVLSPTDRANIQRTIAEGIIVISSTALLYLISHMAGNDDKETNIYDYAIYTLDRSISENIQFTPFAPKVTSDGRFDFTSGWINEGKKLWQRPLAALSYVDESMDILGSAGQWILQGDEPIYGSGVNYGDNKISNKFQRWIPVWNQYLKHEQLYANNKYYKLY